MEDFTRTSHKVKACPICRVGIMTLTTETQQDDGSWKVTKVVRNCGHELESDIK